jgi:citrate lyase subunit beta/citryl-CoA lyase
MPRRSVLFSPGDQPELLRKALRSGADTVVFDLEDAVAPDGKPEARESVREVLSDPGVDPPCEVTVRVNAGSLAEADLDAILGDDARLDAVVVPKVAELADIDVVVDYLADAGRPLPIIALIESAAGVLHAEEIAHADATDALVFGAEDLAAELGATRTTEGTEVLYAREHVVLAASAAGIDAIDTLYTDFEDADGLAEDTAFGLELGYDGKLAIHPAQVSVINDAFTPAPERVAWARRVLSARDEAENAGRGVLRVDGEMIDAPLIAQAETVRDRARAAGVWES